MMLALVNFSQQFSEDAEMMLTTQDVAVINENMPNQFDLIITQRAKKDFVVDVLVNNNIRPLVTWGGRAKTFKTFETLMTMIEKYCFNVRYITIHIYNLKSQATIEKD